MENIFKKEEQPLQNIYPKSKPIPIPKSKRSKFRLDLEAKKENLEPNKAPLKSKEKPLDDSSLQFYMDPV